MTSGSALATSGQPALLETLGELVARQAGNNPLAPAIDAPERGPLDYGRLQVMVSEIGQAVRALGVTRNDRIAIVLPNGPEMAVAFLGVASAAVAAPLNPTYRRDEFEFYLTDLRARALLVPAGGNSPAVDVARARGIPLIEVMPRPGEPAGMLTICGRRPAASSGLEPAEPSDIALVLHTSGTTSRPKQVPLSHANLCASAANVARALDLTSGDRCLNVMPLFHIHGLVASVLASLAAGGTVICTPGFYATEFFEWLDRTGPTWYTAVPTIHQAVLGRATKHREVIARCGLRFIRSSSAALPRAVFAELEETFGVPVIEAYGMTEAAHQMASNPLPPRPRRPGSVGLAAGPDIAIMDETGTLLPTGTIGEVIVRGSNVTRGYENNPVANSAAFSDGWFRTGDQGRLDEEGYLYLTGRLKEIINRGGEKISPREVDDVLMDHPDVVQAVTFAIPSDRLGEEVGAAVVLREGARVREEDLRDFAASRLAEFKVPRAIRLVDEIPKGATGKLQRIGLADRLGLTSVGEPRPAERAEYVGPSTPLEETLADLWAAVLKVERPGVHDHFLDLGGDSMLATLLVARIREELRVEIPIRSLFDAPTIAEQARVAEHFRREEL
jgi:acyl-CoA synthetase (AMP-forming)/AMP-acid ligase II/acyl carrier protein